jgi:hypothetical protein
MLLGTRRLLTCFAAALAVAFCFGASAAGPAGAAAHAKAARAAVRTRKINPLVSLATPAVRAGIVQSDNWSGYDEGLLDTDALAESISAEWTISTATQHTAGQAESSATWVGIGGGCVDMTSGCAVTDPSLIQAGTEQDVSSSGAATYSAWWEVLPLPSLTSSIAVHPGDTVSVSITGPVLWTISFKDLTDGQSFTETVPYTSTMDSAEWIEEAPVVVSTGSSLPVSAGEATLPNLTSPKFDDATLNGHNAGLTPAYEMQMVNSSGAVIATPSAPNSQGDGFNVCTYTSSCAAP